MVTPDLLYPRPNWPGLDAVKRAAARVGRGIKQPPAERAKREAKLRAVLDTLDDHALELWSRVGMIDHRWNGATGQGGYWAPASIAVNRIAGELLVQRRS